jgi:hypothetical protein
MEKWFLLILLIDLCSALKPLRMELGLNRNLLLLEMERNNLMENSVHECLLYYVNVILLIIINMRRNIRVMHEQELYLMIKKIYSENVSGLLLKAKRKDSYGKRKERVMIWYE